MQYDDVLEVLTAFLGVVPVDEDWYEDKYDIADFSRSSPAATATLHFIRHGYFEGRHPFADGWRGFQRPVAFAELQTRLRPIPARGRLFVEFERNDFLCFVTEILRSTQVDEVWYFATYLGVAEQIASGKFSSSLEHYVTRGYFEGLLPYDTHFRKHG